MKIFMRSILSLILVYGCVLTAYSGNHQRIGSAGAQELLIPVGARGIGLGAANLVFATGSDAIYWNPAGVARLTHDVEAEFSHMQYFADVSVEYGALAVRAGDFGTLGFSMKSIGFGEIAVTTEDFPDGTGSTYSPTFINLGASYSKVLSDHVSAGVTATLISERMLSTAASGIGFNFGIQYFGLGIPELNLGIAIKNVGPNMQFTGPDLLRDASPIAGQRPASQLAIQAATFQLPSAMEIGVGYQRKLDEMNTFSIAGNFQNNNSADDVYGLGAEYNYNNLFFLRGSYLTAPQADNDPTDVNKSTYPYDFTMGAGLHYDVSGVDVTFDYTYRHLRLLESNNIITVKLGF